MGEKTFSFTMQQQHEGKREVGCWLPPNTTADMEWGSWRQELASISVPFFFVFNYLFFFPLWLHIWCLQGGFCKHEAAYVILNKAACKSHSHIGSPQTCSV